MNMMKTTALATISTLAATAAYADCGIASGNVNILGNEFGAIQAIVAKANGGIPEAPSGLGSQSGLLVRVFAAMFLRNDDQLRDSMPDLLQLALDA